MAGARVGSMPNAEFRRTALVESATDWMLSTTAPRLRLVIGAPGTGKSTLGRQVAESVSDRHVIVGRGIREAVTRLVELARSLDPDLVAQGLDNLGTRARQEVHNVNSSVGTIIQTIDGVEPINLLQAVVEPVLVAHEKNVLVFVDAVDEDTTFATRRFVAGMMDGRIALTPHLQWLVTSRPGALGRIRTPSQCFELVDLDDSATQRNDVDGHVRSVLEARGFPDGSIAAWQDVCDGNFLVAHFLLEDLADDASLDPETWILHPGLSGVYDRFLARLDEAADVEPEHCLEALTLIAASGRTGLTVGTIARRSSLPGPSVVGQALDGARQFLSVRDRRYASYHQSFTDHLLGASDDPWAVQRVRDAHLATVIDDLAGTRFAALSPVDRGRLPWHVSRVIALTEDADLPDLIPAPRELLWSLYHERGVATRTMTEEDVREMYNPYHHEMLLVIAGELDVLDKEPTAASLESRHNIAHWLGRLGEQQVAISILEAVVELRAAIIGETHPDTMNSLHNLGYRVGQAGDPDRAVELLRRAAEGRRHIDGYPNDRATLTTMHDLAFWTATSGDVETAVELFRDVAERRAATVGPYAAATMTARHNLANWMGKQRSRRAKAEAFDILSDVLADRCEHLGPLHPDSMDSRALYWYRSGVRSTDSEALERAIAGLEEVLRDREALLGEDHPRVDTCRRNLAALQRRRS